jgi:hypothetical protein
MSTRKYLPPVADPGGKLRPQLEEIRAGLGEDVTLADVIRRFIREGIVRYHKNDTS